MKANEFVKKYGLEKSKMAVNGFLPMEEGMPVFDYKSEDLKLLVKSHELVESKGGLDEAKNVVKSQHNLYTDMRLVQAISDVESCL